MDDSRARASSAATREVVFLGRHLFRGIGECFAGRLLALYGPAGFTGSPSDLVTLGNIKQPQNYAEWQTYRVREPLVIIAGLLLVLMIAVGVGATNAVVVNWQSGRAATDSAEPRTFNSSNLGATGPDMSSGDTGIE